MTNPDSEELVKLADEARSAAFSAVSHVGFANYAEREREAKQWVRDAFNKLNAALRRLASSEDEVKVRGLEWTGRNAPGLSEPSALTYSAEQLLGRAAFIDKQIETWKGNPGYIDTLRMEAYALRRAAQTPGADRQSESV